MTDGPSLSFARSPSLRGVFCARGVFCVGACGRGDAQERGTPRSLPLCALSDAGTDRVDGADRRGSGGSTSRLSSSRSRCAICMPTG
eukprot:3397136-Rhodomonas_salina.4